MTPNGARIRAQSRKEVYDRLHKIRLELDDLRSHCGRSDKAAVEALKRTCREQEEEIERLKTEHEEQIKYLKMLLSAKGTDQTELVEAETCIDYNANSQLLQGQLLDRLWAAEKHAWSMEAERDNLNILLSKKVLELNKLQLLYSDQSKRQSLCNALNQLDGQTLLEERILRHRQDLTPQKAVQALLHFLHSAGLSK